MNTMRFFLLAALLVIFAVCSPVLAIQPIGGDAGYYQVTTDPAGADVYFDDSYQGTSPIRVEVSTTGTPGHTLRVTKTGYQEHTQTIQGNPQPGETVPVPVALNPMPGGEQGYYQIDSIPGNADVTFDGRYVGETPVTVQVSVTGTPQHTVSISLPGYKTWTQTYTSNPKPGGSVIVQAYLQPAENTGSVYVTSAPSGATATLDTGDSYNTPCSFPVVPTGAHSLTVFLSGYQPYYVSLKVDSGQTTSINAPLIPVATRGNLQVSSSPAGASVFVDGNYYGTTPATVGNLATGSHTVSLRLAGYAEYSTTVSISAGSTTTINPVLTSSPTYGSISVTSAPAGAGVYLDGTYQGRTGLGQPFNIVSVQPGTHGIHLSLPGYQDYSATITVNSGVITPVFVKFVAAPAQTDGNINIASSPSGAEVYVDNVYQGYSPLTVHNVASGTHSVLMKLSGYDDWQTAVQVTAGQTVPVTATFTPSPVPTKSGVFPAALLAALGIIAILVRRGRA